MYMYSRLAISRSPREQFLPFSTIFCYLLLDFHVKTGTRFSLRDKRLFEISEVEITNRLYMGRAKKKNVSSRRMGTVKDPEQPAKPHNLIRTLVIHLYILQYPTILQAGIEGSDQTARMRSLIWAFAVRIDSKSTLFAWRCTITVSV